MDSQRAGRSSVDQQQAFRLVHPTTSWPEQGSARNSLGYRSARIAPCQPEDSLECNRGESAQATADLGLER